MTFDILELFERAFGSLPDEEMLKVFAGAADAGMSDRTIEAVIRETQTDFNKGYLNHTRPGKEIARRLRTAYKKGVR